MVLSLRTPDIETAIERRAAVLSLMDRGDWSLVEQVRAGRLHITDVVAAVREGDVPKLRRGHHDRPTLGPTIDRYLRMASATKAEGTAKQYRAISRLLLSEFGVDQIMDEVTRERAEQFLHRPRIEGRAWSPRRQALAAGVAGAIWREAIESEAEKARQADYVPSLTDNPWRRASTPEVRPTRAVFLTPAEWRDLAAAAEGRVVAGILGCAFLAGLRAREILHLRPGVDVEMGGPEPVIRVQARDGEYAWRPKTRRGQRDVPMSEALREILRRHVADGYAGSRYLFRPPREDRPLPYQTARGWVLATYRAAGIAYGREGDALTLHSGRHTFASWLAQSGIPLNIVADLLGDTLDVVYQTYAHLSPHTFRAAVGKIDEVVTGNNDSSSGGMER